MLSCVGSVLGLGTSVQPLPVSRSTSVCCTPWSLPDRPTAQQPPPDTQVAALRKLLLLGLASGLATTVNAIDPAAPVANGVASAPAASSAPTTNRTRPLLRPLTAP